MIEKVYFGFNIGQGFILSNKEDELKYVDTNNVIVAGELIKPNYMTSLSGFFNIPIQFVGTLKDEKNLMCFYLGSESDLFGEKHYYDCYYLITNTRIFKKYTEDSGRDFNFKNKVWS